MFRIRTFLLFLFALSLFPDPACYAQVHGRDARYVKVRNRSGGLGEFRQTQNGWVEQSERGTVHYTETDRDEWSIYLTSRSSGQRVQIDLYKQLVLDRDTNGTLFPVDSAARQPPGPNPGPGPSPRPGPGPGPQGPTYWLPVVTEQGTSRFFDYSIQVPDFFVAWVLRSAALGWGGPQTRAINGRQYTFIKQKFVWDLRPNGSNPFRTQQISLVSKSGQLNWEHSPGFQSAGRLNQALADLARLEPGSTDWYGVTLDVLQSPTGSRPNLRFTEAIPPFELEVTRMRQLAQQTRPGDYFSNVTIPRDLLAYQRSMLAYGNAGRRDPNWRRNSGAKTALDLSGPTVLTDLGVERVFKDSTAPPYFNDLQLNAELNAAAQFQAEYQASVGQVTHRGPTNYNGADLSGFGARVRFFGHQSATEGEGAGGGQPGDYPHNWMKTDSHFRPWFNVGARVPNVGLGVAQDAQGSWYFCVVSGKSE